MAGNTEIIDEVVSPITTKQVTDLQALLVTLESQFVDTAKSATALNNITLNAKGFTDLNTKAAASTIALEKLQQQQNNTAKTAVNLEKANLSLANQQARTTQQQEKAAAAAQKALSPYQQLSKQLDELRNKAKDIGAQFGTNSDKFKEASKPVKELDERLKGIDQTLGQSQRNVGNYGNAFKGILTQYIPFGEGTLRVGENLKALGVDFEESASKLGVLGSGFVAFSTAAFIAAIASAAYYLSQFKSTGNEVSKFLGGLKEQFANLGGNIVEGIKNFSPKSLLNLIPFVAAYNAGKGFKESFNKGVDDAAVKIDLVNADELDANNNRALKAQSEYFRALAANRKLDINDRLDYIKKAQQAEGKIVDNQTEISKLYLANAIIIGDKRKKLTDEQTSRLLQGDLKYAQELSEKGQQFSKEGYELYKKGIEKQLEAKEGATNQIVQLQADADNMELRDARELTKALEELDISRIQGEQLREKLILENDDKNYDTKIKALENFTKNSKRLAKIKLADDLAAAQVPGRAGLDPKIVAAKEAKARQDYQNEIFKIDTEGLKQRQDLGKKEIDTQRKNLQELLAANKGAETQTISDLEVANNTRLQLIDDTFDKQADLINEKYAKGKLDQKQAQDELLKLDDQYNIDRLGQEVFLQQSILEVKEAALANDLALAQNRGANTDELQAIINKSGVGQQNNVVAKAGAALSKAVRKQGNDDTKIDRDEKIKAAQDFGTAIQDLQQVRNEASKLEQANTEAEIALLEKKKTAIDEQAKAEIDAVNGSIQSSADKARKTNIIEAQAAQQKKQIDIQIAQAKRKQAEFDKAAAIASIIENTAVAIVKTLAEGGFIFGIPLVPVIAALGAVQLAAAIATPIPKFATGTDNSPQGWAHVGERGTELMIDSSGKVSLTPDKDTLTYLQAGTRIIPNHMIKPERLNYTGGEKVPWREVIAAINANKPIAGKRPVTKVYIGNDNLVARMSR